MSDVKTFSANGKLYAIPKDKQDAFLKDMPEATSVYAFDSDGKKLGIPQDKVKDFLADMPNAKPLYDYPDLDSLLNIDKTRDEIKPETNIELDTLKQDFRQNPRSVMGMNPEQQKQVVQDVSADQIEESANFKGFGRELGYRATRGAHELNRMLINTPDMLNRVAAWTINTSPLGQVVENVGRALGKDIKLVRAGDGKPKRLNENIEQEQEKLTEAIAELNEKHEQGIIESARQGDWVTFTRNLAGGVADSFAPSLAMMVSGMGMSAPGMIASSATVFGAGQLHHIDQVAPDLPEEVKIQAALVNGALESVFETYLGSGAIGQALVKMIKREGKDAATGAIKKGLSKSFADLLTKYPALAPFGEGFEEFGTEITQSLVNKFSGVDPDITIPEILEQAADAFLIGTVAGAKYSLPLYAAQKLTQGKEAGSLSKQEKELQGELKNHIKDKIDRYSRWVEEYKEAGDNERAEYWQNLVNLAKTNQKEFFKAEIEKFTEIVEIDPDLTEFNYDIKTAQRLYNYLDSKEQQQPTTPDSPQIPTVDPEQRVIADSEAWFNENAHESGNLVQVEIPGRGWFSVKIGNIQEGDYPKFLEPDGSITIINEDGNAEGIPLQESMKPVITSKESFVERVVGGYRKEAERRKLAQEAAFEYEGQQYIDTGQTDENGNFIIVPLDENMNPVEQQATVLTPEEFEQVAQRKQVEAQQAEAAPKPVIEKAKWGKNEYQYTVNEDGTASVLIPNKVTPEQALKEIQAEFKDNAKYEAVPVTETREIPAKDRFSDPTTQEVMTGINIVPKQIATPVTIGDNKKTTKAEPKYLFGKENVSREEVAEMINLAETPQELEGLRIDNDPELQELLLQKFPEKSPRYLVAGQEANETTVKAMIRLGKNLDQIQIENNPELQTLYDKKVKEFTKTVNSLQQNVKKVPEIQAEQPVITDNLQGRQGEMLPKSETIPVPELQNKETLLANTVDALSRVPKKFKDKLGKGKNEELATRYVSEKGTGSNFEKLFDSIILHAKAKSSYQKLTPEEKQQRLVENEQIFQEPISLEHFIIQYFLNGGKVDSDELVTEVIGRTRDGKARSEAERRQRIWMSKKSKEGDKIMIDQLRELASGTIFEDEANSINGFRNAMLEVIRSYPTQKLMRERALQITEGIKNDDEIDLDAGFKDYTPEQFEEMERLEYERQLAEIQEINEAIFETINSNLVENFNDTEFQEFINFIPDIETDGKEGTFTNDTGREEGIPLDKGDRDGQTEGDIPDGSMEPGSGIPNQPEITLEQLISQVQTETDRKAESRNKQLEGLNPQQRKEAETNIAKIESGLESKKTALREAINAVQQAKDHFEKERTKQSSLFADQEPSKPFFYQGIAIDTPKDFSPDNINRIIQPLVKLVDTRQKELLTAEEKLQPQIEQAISTAKAQGSLFEQPQQEAPDLDVKENLTTETAEEQKPAESPLYREYNNLKEKNPDVLLLLNINDYYQTFGEDAIKASKILGTPLTKNKKGIEITGFDKSSLDAYLPKLVKAGNRVALADEIGTPKNKKPSTPLEGKLNEASQKNQSKRLKEVGKNADGDTIYEDQWGARSVIRNGIKRTQKVAIIPSGGYSFSDPKGLYKQGEYDYLTDKEIQKFEKELNPEPQNKSGEIIPHDGWRTNLIKARSYAGQLMTNEQLGSARDKGMDWTKTESIVKAIDDYLAQKDQKQDKQYGADNKLVSNARYEELKKRMKDKLNNLNAGFDPELLAMGAEMAAYHVEAGARRFSDFAKRMVNDLGDGIKPYLKAIYNAARDLPGMETLESQMDEYSTVKTADIDKLIEQQDKVDEIQDLFEKGVPETKPTFIDEVVENIPKEREQAIESLPKTVGNVTLESISDKAIIVKGETRPIKDGLKSLGGKWNGKLGGWIYPKTKTAQVQNYLNDLNNYNAARREAMKMLTKDRSATIRTPKERFIDAIKQRLLNGQKIKNTPELVSLAQSAGFQHIDNIKQLYDVASMSLNQHINDRAEEFNPEGKTIEQVKDIISKLNELSELLPTETQRSATQVELQQYSTPPSFAFLVNWAANINSNDRVLEPSAGEGNIAIFAKNSGAQVYVNEWDADRKSLLQQIGFTQISQLDAKLLHVSSAFRDKPITAVVMNPPFSKDIALGNKMDLHAAEKHIDAALSKLEDEGRLVAIVGKGMSMDSPTHKQWWDAIKRRYHVRANILVSGDAYTKKGTSFDNRLLVIDKNGETFPSDQILTGSVNSYEDLADLLQQLPQKPRISYNKYNESTNRNIEEQAGSNRGGSQPTLFDSPATDVSSVQRGNAGQPANVNRDTQRPSGRNTGTNEVQRPGSNQSAGSRTGGSGATNQRPERSPNRGTTQANTGSRTSSNQNEGERRLDGNSGQTIKSNTVVRLPKNAVNVSGGYIDYQPEVTIEGAKDHPTKLVESTAMGSVSLPEINYKPSLPESTIETGALSSAQLEDVILAGNAHRQLLPTNERRGFFLGAGTGYGKGRTIAAIILDNWNKGNKKAVWISKNDKAHYDSSDYWRAVGGDPQKLFSQKNAKNPIKADEGVLLMTYGTLKTRFDKDADYANRPGFWQGQHENRIQQLAHWLGKDFDGVIVFDESHMMANAIEQQSGRGKSKPSQAALSGLELQRLFPKAKIVYSSATGATEVSNLVYAQRLGLWGDGTPFGSPQEFIQAVEMSGVAGMEIIAKDLKAMGLYTAKTLSYEGVGYRNVEHIVSPEQKELYNRLARAWQTIYRNIQDAIELNNTNSQGKSAALSAFWGGQQRFFNQIIITMQMPSVIQDIQRKIDEGNAVVIQLVNTGEAQQERALAEAKAESDGEINYEDLDMSPKSSMLEMLRRSFPVGLYQERVDENGNTVKVPVRDEDGNHVQNPDAVRMRDRLIEQIDRDITLPESPLDMILNTFGVENVAEITGRTNRVVRKVDESGDFVKAEESRTPAHALQDKDDFMDGKKNILVFSNAGGTGASFHADLSKKNQKQRSHYVLQAGWQADVAVQGFGRSHRANQRVAPELILPTTNLKSQKRFISSIARRLEQLGALTKGQRDTANQGMFSETDNLEGRYAKQALFEFYRDVEAGRVRGVDMNTLEEQMVIKIYKESDGNREYDSNVIFDTKKFLNRLMTLEVDLMDNVFDAYIERLEEQIRIAKESNSYDAGIEQVTALNTKVADEKEIYTDENTGAKTYLTTIELELRNDKRSYDELLKYVEKYGDRFQGFIKEKNSGRVYGLVRQRKMNADGSSENVYKRISVITESHIDYIDLRDKYVKIAADEASALWDQEYNDYPATRKKNETIVKGLILPIWNRLPQKISVKRYVDENGTAHLGRYFFGRDVQSIIENFNVQNNEFSPTELKTILNEGGTVKLSNGFSFSKTKYQGLSVLKVSNTVSYRDRDRLERSGAMFVVRSSMTMQGDFFIPMDRAENALTEIIRLYNAPVSSIEDSNGDPVINKTDSPPAYRRLSPTGFYSTVESALERISQEKGTPEQFKAMLLKNGAKQAEMDWLGWDEHFEDKLAKVTKAEIQEWINQNRIDIQENILSSEQFPVTSDDVESVVQNEDGEWVVTFKEEAFGESIQPDAATSTEAVNLAIRELRDSGMLDEGEPEDRTQYSNYQLPGGTNYQERLLTMPSMSRKFNQSMYEKYGDDWINKMTPEEEKRKWELHDNNDTFFQSSHFKDNPNIVAHVRHKDYTDTEGRRILLLEEIQSDWAQEGKKEGFKLPFNEAKKEAEEKGWRVEKVVKNDYGKVLPEPYYVAKKQYSNQRSKSGKTEKEAWDNLFNDNLQGLLKIPDMPFKQTPQWINLVARRMMRHAAENGYDGIAWTPGEAQAGRYADTLIRQVNEIKVRAKNNGNYSIYAKDKNGNNLTVARNIEQSKLSSFIGKELAEKAVKDTQEQSNVIYSGLDLKVGGEGIKSFYDQIVPSQFNKLAKPFNSKVGTTVINLNEGDQSVSRVGVEGLPSDGMFTVPFVPVTPEMRNSVLEGVPLFKEANNLDIIQNAEDRISNASTPEEKFDAVYQTVNEINRLTGRIAPVSVVRNADELESALNFSGADPTYIPNIMETVRDNKGRIPGFYYNGRVFFITDNVKSHKELIGTWLHETSHSQSRKEFSKSELQELFNELGEEYVHSVIPQQEYDNFEIFKADEAISYTIEELLIKHTLNDILNGDVNIDNLPLPLQFAVDRVLKRFKQHYGTVNNQDGIRGQVPRIGNERGSGAVRQNQEGQPGTFGRTSIKETPLEGFLKKIIGEKGASNLDRAEESNRRMKDLEVAKEMEAMAGKPVNKNQGIFRGKRFWSGEVNLMDGVIEEVHSYEVAEKADFHHSHYFSAQAIERMSNEDSAFFWIQDGEIKGNWRNSIDNEIKSKILSQIGIRKSDTITPKTIRLATGWEKGVDGKWRYELPDGKLSENWENATTLQEAWDNNRLFEAYPELKEVRIAALVADWETNEGTYYPINIDGKPTIYAAGTNVENLRSTLLHEIQHAIQDIEGFARGGDMETFTTEELYRKAKELDLLGKGLSDKAIKYKAYQALAGEVESRNVQKRADFTPGQRWNTTLQETEDVPRDQQIVTGESGISQSISISNKNVSEAILEMAKNELDTLENVLFNYADIDVVYDEYFDEVKLKGNAGRDAWHSKGINSAKYTPSKKEFINWLFSERPTNPKEYTQDSEWIDNISKLRSIAQKYISQKGSISESRFLDDNIKKYPTFEETNNSVEDGLQGNLPRREQLGESERIVYPDGTTWEVPGRRSVKGEAYKRLIEHLMSGAKRFDPKIFDSLFNKLTRKSQSVETIPGGNPYTIAYLIYKNLPDRTDHGVLTPETLNIDKESFDSFVMNKWQVGIQSEAPKTVFIDDVVNELHESKVEYRTDIDNTPAFKRVNDKTPVETIADHAGQRYKERRDAKRTYAEVRDGMREFFKDVDLPIRRLQERIKEMGGKITDRSNPYRDITLAKGRMEALYREYTNVKMKPIIDTTAKIISDGMDSDNILPYTIAKHALERNPDLRENEVNDWIKRNPDASDSEIENFRKSLENKDYSGVMEFQEGWNETYRNPEELAQDIVDDFESRVKPELIEELWKNIGAASQETLNIWKASNAMSKEEYEYQKQRYKNFVPLRGWRESAAKELSYVKKGGSGTSLRHAEGRRSMAENPLAYMQNIAFKALAEQVDNEVKQSMLNLVADNYDKPEFKQMYELKTAYYVRTIQVDGSEVWELARDAEGNLVKPPSDMFESGDATIKRYTNHERRRTYSEAGQHEVIVKGANMDHAIVFKNKNLNIAQAMNNQNVMYRSWFTGEIHDIGEWNDPLSKSIGRANNVLKGMYTSFNIVFPLTNFSRDAQEAALSQWISGESGAAVIKNYKMAFPAVYRAMVGKSGNSKEDQLFKRFELAGGQTGFTHLKTPEQIEKELNLLLKDALNKGKVQGALGRNFRHLVNNVEIWNRLFEDATRFSVFASAVEAGHTDKEAARQAKEASVNFNRKGKSSKSFDAWWAFWNVALEAMNKNFGLAKRYPARFATVAGSFAAAGFLMAMLNDMLPGGDDDDDYYNIGDFARHNYLLIPNIARLILKGDKGDKYLRIPLPQFWRGFYSAGSLAYDVMAGKETVEKATVKGLINFAGGLSPVDIPGFYKEGKFSIAPLIPTVVKPIHDVIENRDFMGYRIAKEPFTKAQEQELARSGLGKNNVNPAIKLFTDLLFKAAGGEDTGLKSRIVNGELKTVPGFFDINPSVVEHLIKGYTGGTGGVVSDIMTTAYQTLAPTQEVDFKNVPFVNAFIRKTPEAKWKTIQTYYDLKDEMKGYKTVERAYRQDALSGGNKDRYVGAASNTYAQSYLRILDSYDAIIGLATQNMDFKTAEGSEQIISLMEDAIKSIDKLKTQYNKK